jgi:uncharacterized protein YcnI
MNKVFGSVLVVLASVSSASAHVIVSPTSVGVAANQTFSVSVPSEKDGMTTTALRLVMPSGLKDIMPTVHGGWSISTKKESGDLVTEINWNGGTIPNGQRDDFTFRAQAPAKAGELAWKAYQTYSDGSIVSWDQKPMPGKEMDDALTPYSVTAVVNDLTGSRVSKDEADSGDTSARLLGLLAIIISVSGVIVKGRRR